MDDRNQIEEIKNRLNIVDVVDKYVSLKKTGANYSGLCPFHKEKTGSFFVNEDLQRYKCFGCGKSGDIFNFVQEIEHLDFKETLEKLANQAGVKLDHVEKNTKYKDLEDINYIATKYYYKELKKDARATKYVKERGLNQESIKNFGIGYAPKYPNLLQELNKAKKYTRKQLIDSGLFTLKENVLKEKFRDRIMFPIRSKRGKVIGFTARILPDNEYGPKYMNTPETPIFHKKENLFAQYEAKQEIRKQDLAIVCEGSMDVISAHQHGVKNIVAPLGTSLTTEQLQSISQLTKNVLFFFDSDSAGQNALIRAFKIASQLGVNPYAANSLPYKDIDELLQKEPEKFHKIIKNKKEAFSYILYHELENKNLDKLEDADTILNNIVPLVRYVKDVNTRRLYINRFEKITKLHYGEESLRKNEVTKGKITKLPSKQKCFTDFCGVYIKNLLMYWPVQENLLLDKKFIKSEHWNKIYTELLELDESFTKENLYNKFQNDPDLQKMIEDTIFSISEINEDKTKAQEDIKEIAKRIKIDYYKEEQKQLRMKIAMNEELDNDEDKLKYLNKLQKITKIIQDIQNE
ncbi:DNA primase [bacterium]|nr:DNA primase [bacterium]